MEHESTFGRAQTEGTFSCNSQSLCRRWNIKLELCSHTATIAGKFLYQKNCIFNRNKDGEDFPSSHFFPTSHHPSSLYTIYQQKTHVSDILCVCVFYGKKPSERPSERAGEGCAIDFLSSSRTNNIPLTGVWSPNMKWKSTKLWNIYFPFVRLWPHLRSKRHPFSMFFLRSLCIMFTYGCEGIWILREIWKRV